MKNRLPKSIRVFLTLIALTHATVLPSEARLIPKSEPPPLNPAQIARIEKARREGRLYSPFFKNEAVLPAQNPPPQLPVPLTPAPVAQAPVAAPVPKAVPAIPNQDLKPGDPRLPQDPRAGMVYQLLNARNFQVYNRLLGYYEDMMVPAGTQVRLREIITTRATYRQISYWLFDVVKLAPPSQDNIDHILYDFGVGSEIWAIHRIKPNEPLVNPLFPFKDIDTLITNSDVYSNLPNAKNPLNFGIIPSKRWSPKCLKFIDEDGQLGVWGQVIYNKLGRTDFSRMLDESHVTDLPLICPAYPKFSKENPDARKKLWVHFIASMAMSESGCRPGIEGVGPNGTLVGLLQLHKGKETSYGKCPATNSYNGSQNVNCGMHMLREQVDKRHALFVYVHQTYWDVLIRDRPRAPIVKARMRAIKSCQVPKAKKKPLVLNL